MKSQVSLLGLTVGDYFKLCNWQLASPSSNNSLPSKQSKISSPQRPVVLSGLTVETFFKLCNWQLLPQLELVSHDNDTTSLEPIQSAAQNPPKSLPCLTVTEFFSLCNWQSLPPEVRKSQPLRLVEPKPPLAQSVQVFFQMIPWEGSPKIGELPQASSVSALIAPSQGEMNLNDLSKLF
jgi:hypothetical protein